MYSRDAFYPSPEYYDPGSYVVSDNVRYSFNLFFRFPSGWYAGAGPLFSWTFSGEYGSADRRGAFSSEMTGLDIAISVCGGYEWEWIRDRLSVPVGAQWNAILTVPGVVLMEFGIHAGLIWRTGFFSDPDEERP